MNIIVVEDEQRSREGLCRLLKNTAGGDCSIAQASNGSTALDIILQSRPDAVFTDIKMPVMDGLSLMGAVRSHGLKTEFVVISGFAEFEFARQAMLLDAVDYLLKPVTQEDVTRAYDRVCEKINGIKRPGIEKDSLRNKYPGAHPAVSRALDIIETSYSAKINQRELAEELGLSPEYFSYLFSKNTGSTFSDVLRAFRIEKAKEMYLEGTVPVREIPFAAGFSDPKYFNQVFKSVTGLTPSEFNKNVK